MNTIFQIPEILDNILEQINSGDSNRRSLYSCLFVNHRFHTQATRLLYRKLSFHARPNEKRLEDNLCNDLCNRPALASNVRGIFLDISQPSNASSIPFDVRI